MAIDGMVDWLQSLPPYAIIFQHTGRKKGGESPLGLASSIFTVSKQGYGTLKEIKELQKIPMDEYIAYEELLVEADDVWHRAKEQSDFALFCPLLEKIFDFQKRFAAYCAPEMKPYEKNISKFVMMPAMAKGRHVIVEKRMNDLDSWLTVVVEE